jgi:hypothetical protein
LSAHFLGHFPTDHERLLRNLHRRLLSVYDRVFTAEKTAFLHAAGCLVLARNEEARQHMLCR